MRIFLKKTVLLLIPILVIALFLESYIKTADSTFLLKSKHFKKLDYEGIILGSSHNQSAINPAHLKIKATNVAMGSQDLKLDLELLKKVVQINPRLKYAILEFSYHRFRANPKKYWRNGIYEYFYEIDLSENINFSKYFLISSNIKFFRNYFGDILKKQKLVYHYNKFGFDENDFDGVFKKMNYEEKKILETAKARLRIDDWSTLDTIATRNSLNYLKEINTICANHNIKLILVAPPVYKTYSDEFRVTNIQYREKAIESLKKENPYIFWMNFENDQRFNVKHFKNDDHLNSEGARLFTGILNDSIHNLGI